MSVYDERLEKLQRDAARKRRLESMLGELRAQRSELEARVSELEAIKLQEQEDVERLESGGITALFYSLVGGRGEDDKGAARGRGRCAQIRECGARVGLPSCRTSPAASLSSRGSPAASRSMRKHRRPSQGRSGLRRLRLQSCWSWRRRRRPAGRKKGDPGGHSRGQRGPGDGGGDIGRPRQRRAGRPGTSLAAAS